MLRFHPVFNIFNVCHRDPILRLFTLLADSNATPPMYCLKRISEVHTPFLQTGDKKADPILNCAPSDTDTELV